MSFYAKSGRFAGPAACFCGNGRRKMGRTPRERPRVHTGEEPPLQQKRRQHKRRGLHVPRAKSWAAGPREGREIPGPIPGPIRPNYCYVCSGSSAI